MQSLRDEDCYNLDDDDDDDGENQIEDGDFERRQLKHAMKESRQMAWMEEEGHRHSVSNASGRSSQPSSSGIKREPPRSYSTKEGASMPISGLDPYMFPSKQKSVKGIFSEGASMPVSGLDPYMFPSKQKSVKGIFSGANLKKVGKAISKFFLFNAIPFNAADSGPYYQSMIDTIADAGPAYFLNPIFQYSNQFFNHPEVRSGLKEVIKRLEPDLNKQARAMNEV
ncbi:unnamed protein product [Ilex paraguariensis]|uniref:Uncharacterized protein n=1 Tax=Ilex paraguariensis TaxID=185542 RepID=A0ABC8SGN6_9AQUA